MNNVPLPPDGGLFQSDMWKEFQESRSHQLFKTDFFWGALLHSPVVGYYGEISRGPSETTLEPRSLKKTIQNIATKYHLSFLRVEPQHASVLENILQTGLRVKKAPLDVQPREFLLVSLLATEQELLAGMKSKTRYNIRLAQKKGVEVRRAITKEETNAFLDILAATATRKGISFHQREYFQSFMHFFSGTKGQTFIAVRNGQVLAGATLVFFEYTAYYVHGGSSDEGRNLMAPHVLQWELMQRAKRAGCTQYDFGGVALKHREPGKDWAGITRFKTGFAPATESVLLPGTYDIIFSPVRYYSYLFLTYLKHFLYESR